jgi:hypothetical protein
VCTAAEGDQLVVLAVIATQAQAAVRQDAAFQEGVELVLHELRQVGSGCGPSLLEEVGGVLLHQAIQRGLLRSVTLVVDQGAVRRFNRSIRLPANGLHAMLPRW